MVTVLLVSLAFAFGAAFWLIRTAREHPETYAEHLPQRFHVGHVPRLGGVAMFAGCSAGWLWMMLSEPLGLPGLFRLEPWRGGVLWALAALVLAGGVYEDLTQRFSPRWRLLMTLAAGIAAWVVLDVCVPRIDLPVVDAWWGAVAWPGVLLAILAIAGLPHAFNLIDGYNGLAAIVALVICAALAYVALVVGDRNLAAVLVVMVGATAGFLFWNYPRGLIFAGDGGAYLWGLVIAVASIQLVQQHTRVSPWFPMLLLIYPVWETLFSIWRKAARGQSPGVADALHFHQLIYRRIVRGVFHDDEARRMLMRNNRTSPYLWGFALLTVAPAVLFWNNTPVLVFFTVLFVVSYVYAYVSIVRFKVPRWLRR